MKGIKMKKTKISTAISLYILMSSGLSLTAHAAEKLETVTVKDNEESKVSSIGRDLQDHPGAATVVTGEQIDQRRPLSVIDVMKTVPGVLAMDEYGRGMRPNIGFRGMKPNRSQTGTLLMADGVPIQPALYGAKGSYYGIPVDNIDHIETIKGGSSVLLGPGNIGGTVNYITTNPPKDRETRVKATARQGGMLQTYLSTGDTNDAGQGYLLSLNNMNGSTARDNSDTKTTDIGLKLTTPISGGGSFWTRFNYFNEASGTPMGITAAQFEDDATHSSKPDYRFRGQRAGADVHLDLPLSKDVDLETLSYLSYYERNWRYGPTIYERAFINIGLEPRVRVRNLAGGNWVFGTRVHYENRDEVKIKLNTPTATNGDVHGVSNMSSSAISPYFEGEYAFGDLTVIGGLRQENISQTARKVQHYKSDGAIAQAAAKETKDTTTILGSLAATYKLNKDLNVYGGVNRAMQPLSFKYTANPQDKVVGGDLESEIGTTFELGLRGKITKSLYIDADIFTIKYDNKVISDGNGKLFNGGASSHTGLETAFVFDATEDLTIDINYTYVDATQDSNEKGFKGNKLEMAPENTLAWGVTYDVTPVVSLRVDGLYVGERYSDAANTEAENPEGTKGKLDSHHVMNVRGDFQVTNNIELFAGINNVTDEKVKQRRQGGIVPGLPLSAYIGVDARF